MDFAERTIRQDMPHPFPQDATGWHYRGGLHYHEVEAVLDWLELAGVEQREVQVEVDGTFRVRWQEPEQGASEEVYTSRGE